MTCPECRHETCLPSCVLEMRRRLAGPRPTGAKREYAPKCDRHQQLWLGEGWEPCRKCAAEQRSPEDPNKTKTENESNMKKATTERAVIVTTEHRGVFFGYASDTSGEQIALRASRLCLYWSTDVKGFMGLAGAGPTKGCRIGPPADITLRKITSVIECTPAAVKAWEAAPWT